MLELNFKEYGSGDQHLIVLHGFLGSLDNWHSLASEWSKAGLHVWTIDQRNHGKSPHTQEHSLQLMVDDLNDFMYQHHIPKAVILGHSMGGKVAMMFAIQFPEITTKLIVADIAPREYKRAHDDVFDAIFHVDLQHITSRKEAEAAMMPYLGDFGTRQFILKSLNRLEDGTYEWKFNLRTLYQEYEEIRKAVTSTHVYEREALFIKGALSGYVKERDVEDIQKLFPNAQIQTVEDAGHWLHADKPAVFSELVLTFCK